MNEEIKTNEEETEWHTELVECVFCGWRWTAVFPHGCTIEELECPECGVQSARRAVFAV